MKKLFSVLLIFIMTFVSGCGVHKNPLINDKTISYLKSRIDIELFGDDRDIVVCGAYYAGSSTEDKNNLKVRCDKWSEKEFSLLQKNSSTPYGATIQDFRDSALWKIVTPEGKKF